MYLKHNYNKVFKKLSFVIFCGLILYYPLSVFANNMTDNNQLICNKNRPLIFGILPFVSAKQLVIQFSPLAHYLSNELNVTVRIETAPDFASFAQRTVQDQRYDILFTAPHLYTAAHSKAGYRLVASVDSPGMRAVIVTPRQSNIIKLDDLRGKRLATVHQTGLATLLIKKHLSAAGINPNTDLSIINTPSHDASLLSSYHGITDASALMQPPFETASPQVRNSMRIIAKTDSTPHIPISVSPRLSENCANKISQILLQMKTTKRGRQALRHNSFSGFKKTSPEDYDTMKNLFSQ